MEAEEKSKPEQKALLFPFGAFYSSQSIVYFFLLFKQRRYIIILMFLIVWSKDSLPVGHHGYWAEFSRV